LSLSLYDITVPVMRHGLARLAVLLEKGEAHARDAGVDPAGLTGARLAPEMFDLARQVQIASDTAKGCAARLAGEEPPSWPDEEKTFTELRTRVARTIAYLDQTPRAAIEGAEDRIVTLKLRAGPVHFKGTDYVLRFALPNFYFHVATAYGLLRHNGVAIGKLDYLGPLS